MTRESAMPLSVVTVHGEKFVSVDDLVALFDDMAVGVEGPQAKLLATLSQTFSRGASGAPKPSAPTPIKASICGQCKSLVARLHRMGGDPVVVDCELDPSGGLMVIDTFDGKTIVAPYGEHLDGIGGMRLREHACASSTGTVA